jgi:nicotinamide-nucleotide amidase
MTFLNAEQQALVQQIATDLTARNETIAVAESTTGGLLSAALLWVAGASRYYAGGAVVYTLASRTALAGVPQEELANYQGTTEAMIASMAESIRVRLNADWGIAEAGIAGPTGGRSGRPPGRTVIGIAGPVSRRMVVETGLVDREANMTEFTTRALTLLRDALKEARSS